jgi:hypothetical protein
VPGFLAMQDTKDQLHTEETLMRRLSTHRSIIFLKSSLSIIFFLVLGIGAVRADDTYTGDPPPVAVGSACNESTVYNNWSTETKTAWQVSMLLAVPDGTSPEEWSGATAFLNSFQQTTGGNKNIDSLAGALLSVWSQSFQTPALLYGKFDRSITTEKRDLQCISETWQIPTGSYSVTAAPDSSEWVRIFPEAQDQSATTTQVVTDVVNRILATVNSQPGADTRPFHKYTVTGS